MRRCLIVLCGLAAASPAWAERADLPPAEMVARALDEHPLVTAAAARLSSARARSDMLRVGPQEVVVNSSLMRRNVEREGGFDEFDTTVSRAVRLPGKAALDRQAGALGVEVAQNQMEDVRHQAALTLSGLWHDWITSAAHRRNDEEAVRALDEAAAAVRRRLALGDAAQLEVDQAMAALGQAQAQAASSLAQQEQAHATLAASYPEVSLPAVPPTLASPEATQLDLSALRALVIARSHEIRAAERDAQRLEILARRARADRTPDPSMGVRLFSERGGAETGAGVVASIPLAGNYRRAADEEAMSEANAARLTLAAVQREIQAIADADRTNARARLEAWRSAEASALSASAAVDRTERGYKAGQIDLVDLLYARRQATEARRLEIDARSAADRALLKIQIDSHTVWAADEEEEP